MAASKKINSRNGYILFIDTNIYLDFYRNQNEQSLKYLEKIDGLRSQIITTSQVEMEFKKHRQKVIYESIRNLSKLQENHHSVPAILADAKAYGIIQDCRGKIKEQQNRLKTRIDNIFRDPVRNDDVYKTLQRLFKNEESPLNLHINNDKKYAVRKKALKRFMMGYPPRKKDDTSIGDSINWEWIIECAIASGKDIIIVSRDADYGETISKESFINDWLLQEFKERISQKRKLMLTDKLSIAFKEMNVPISKEMESDEDQFIKQRSQEQREEKRTEFFEIMNLH